MMEGQGRDVMGRHKRRWDVIGGDEGMRWEGTALEGRRREEKETYVVCFRIVC